MPGKGRPPRRRKPVPLKAVTYVKVRFQKIRWDLDSSGPKTRKP